MPALPDAAKILKVAITGTYQVATWANIFHVRYTGTAPSVADLTAFNGDFMTEYVNGLLDNMSNFVDATEIETTDLTTTSSARSGAPVTGAAGTNLGDILPANVAAVASWKIARRYRGGHPRTYMVGVTETQRLNVTTLQPAFVTALQNGANAFLAGVNAITVGTTDPFELGSLSYYSGGVLRAVPVFDPFQSAVVNNRIDSQRRRLGR